MMGIWRRRIGRFGSVRRVASTAAVAMLAVSPAFVPMTGSDLDGVGPAIAEAVFGGPLAAQETPESCIVVAEAEYRACLARNPWYKAVFCWAARILDIFACGLEVVTG